jgi:hypothetical protein
LSRFLLWLLLLAEQNNILAQHAQRVLVLISGRTQTVA